jgi:6-phosphogluconolactonase (cycloisomerase 2 family)
MRLWIGTYPEAGQGAPVGQGEGIWSVELDPRSGALSGARLAAVTPAPSFLALGPAARPGDSGPSRLLYAVNEDAEGQLTALRAEGDRLAGLAGVPTAGAHPCHLLAVPDLAAVVVANYSSGSVSVIRLDSAGLPEGSGPAQVIRFEGSGPRTDRQEGPHAHYLLWTPTRSHLLVCDLGTDRIHRLRVDRRGLAYDGVAAELPPGSGPRHAVFSPTGSHLHVLGELDGRLYTLRWDGPTATGRPAERTDLGTGHPSHLTLSDGLLACGSRGDDRLSLFSAGPQPRLLRNLRLPGSWPRHHAAIGDWLIVAQQHRGGVGVLDQAGTVRGPAEIPSPACVLLAG